MDTIAYKGRNLKSRFLKGGFLIISFLIIVGVLKRQSAQPLHLTETIKIAPRPLTSLQSEPTIKNLEFNSEEVTKKLESLDNNRLSDLVVKIDNELASKNLIARFNAHLLNEKEANKLRHLAFERSMILIIKVNRRIANYE